MVETGPSVDICRSVDPCSSAGRVRVGTLSNGRSLKICVADGHNVRRDPSTFLVSSPQTWAYFCFIGCDFVLRLWGGGGFLACYRKGIMHSIRESICIHLCTYTRQESHHWVKS